jgi:hypothetical protein
MGAALSSAAPNASQPHMGHQGPAARMTLGQIRQTIIPTNSSPIMEVSHDRRNGNRACALA